MTMVEPHRKNDHATGPEEGSMSDRKHTFTADVRSLALIYRLASGVWLLYSLALLFTAVGSQLLAFAEPFRMTVIVLTAITGLAMVVRLFVPGRPRWSRWTMPLIGTVATSTFTLTLFASEMSGGLTPSRAGFALLLLIPALGAYVSWISERAVNAP